MQVSGQIVDASNMTLLASSDGVDCIYKPVSGETPLWDFPNGTLGKREVAAYELSTLFPITLIPLTVWRDEGPYGPGMCQLFIDTAVINAGSSQQPCVDVVPYGTNLKGFINILQARDGRGNLVTLVHEDRSDLRWLALLDAVINNADRKGGHILQNENGILGIDHGVTFHCEPKLRTVLWGWADQALTHEELDLLHMLGAQLQDVLGPWLTAEEISACAKRVEDLVASAKLPTPSPSWPSIPWPVF